MAKSKKFELNYSIKISGQSAEQEDGSTFLGGLLNNAVRTFVEAIKLQWPNVEVELTEEDPKKFEGPKHAKHG